MGCSPTKSGLQAWRDKKNRSTSTKTCIFLNLSKCKLATLSMFICLCLVFVCFKCFLPFFVPPPSLGHGGCHIQIIFGLQTKNLISVYPYYVSQKKRTRRMVYPPINSVFKNLLHIQIIKCHNFNLIPAKNVGSLDKIVL